MDILVRPPRLALVRFERTKEDYALFNEAIDFYIKDLDLPWHPLLMGAPNAFRQRFLDTFADANANATAAKAAKSQVQILRIPRHRGAPRWIADRALDGRAGR